MEIYRTIRTAALVGSLLALPYVCDGGCSTYGEEKMEETQEVVEERQAVEGLDLELE